MLDYTQRYQELLRELGEDGRRVLSDFLRDAIETITGTGREGHNHHQEGQHD